MKNVEISDPKKVELVEVPDPKAKDEFVVVKIHAAPMCTEYKRYANGKTAANLGHEASGEVVEVAQSCRVKVGDRVVVMPQYPCGKCDLCLKGDYIFCENSRNLEDATGQKNGRSTFSQYCVKQDWLLIPIPEGMSYDHAGMALCALGPTFTAMEVMGVDSSDTVLITGLGPVGLGGAINAMYRGARVIGVESYPYRVKLAKDLGVDVVIDPNDENALKQIMDITKGKGVDKAVDCAGTPESQRLALNAVRRRGQFTFVAEGKEFTIHTSKDMLRKGLTLHGAWHYNMSLSPRLMEVIANSSDLIDKLITHTFPLRDIQKAWELQMKGECGKIVLHPWE